MEHLRDVLGQPKIRFTSGEKVYIGFMTGFMAIVLLYRIASYIFCRLLFYSCNRHLEPQEKLPANSPKTTPEPPDR